MNPRVAAIAATGRVVEKCRHWAFSVLFVTSAQPEVNTIVLAILSTLRVHSRRRMVHDDEAAVDAR
jgi:hypothetical protein